VVSIAARLTVECAGSGLGEWIFKPCPSARVGRSAQLAVFSEPLSGNGGPCGLDGADAATRLACSFSACSRKYSK
jgi:hypothetical protein